MAMNNYDLPTSTVLIDSNADGNKYIGETTPGQGTTAGKAKAQWAILRISTTGTVKAILWAGGNDNYGNVWDDRTSLEYS